MIDGGGDGDVHVFDLCFAYLGLAAYKPVGRRTDYLFEVRWLGFVYPGWRCC